MSVTALKVEEVVERPVGKRARKAAAAASNVCKLCDLPQDSSAPSMSLAARRELALQYRPAAKKLALSMITKWKCRIEADELQSVIDLSLCEAAMRYNQSRGAGFMTFLYYHLKGKLIKTIVARSDKGLLFIEDYERSRLNVSQDDDHSDIRSIERLSLAAQGESPETDEVLYRQQLVDLCEKACQRLRGIEKEVIRRVYFENKELSEVTDELGYSRGHLFRVRMRALNKIRRQLAAYS